MMFKFRQIICYCLLIFLSVPSQAHAAKKKKKTSRKSFVVSANSAILIDLKNHKRYYGKDVDQRVVPASTTKILTALLVLEKLSLDEYIVVSKNAPKVQPTKLDLVPGEQYKVRDLLYAILLKSANDAAVVLAEAVAGSHSNFVNVMNERARQLGAKHSKFANAHGLPDADQQYTTASDMALILGEALKHDFFRQAIKFKYRTIYSKNGRQIHLKSHNKSLFLGWKTNIYGKTGYTRQAKSCFVGIVPKGKKVLVVAVFGCTKRWDDIKYIVERYGKVDL